MSVTEARSPLGTPDSSGDSHGADSADELSFTKNLRKHRVGVPTVLQMEVTECGAASLAMILAHYGRWETLEDLRIACGVSRDGANAKAVLMAARSFGLEAKGVSISLNRLPEQSFPLIAYWDFSHFLVIEGTSRHGVYVNDPARGRALIPWEEADKSFTGLILRLAPTKSFVKSGSSPSALASIRWRIAGVGGALTYMLVAGLAMAIPVLLGPLALQAFVQQFLIGGLREWAYIAGGVMAVSLLLSLWLGVWQSTVARRLTQAMTAREARILVTRALRLPMTFYAQRYPGEVASRLHLVDAVARVVSSTIVPAAIGLVTSIVVAFALFAFAWQLAIIALIAAAGVLIAMRSVRAKRINQAGVIAQESAALSGTVGYSLRSIDTIKATGGEDAAVRKILGYMAKVSATSNQMQISSALVGVLPSLVSGIAVALIVGVGGLLVALGQISTGAYVAVMALLPIFLRPLSAWSSAVDTVQQARIWLARLDDLLDQSEEVAGTSIPAGGGSLELRNVSFQYAPGSVRAVNELSLRVEPGKRVALVGASGSGKSTAARLAVGLLQPTEGEVLLDGVPVVDCAPSVRAQSLGYVEQEVVLFAGSIRDNITLFDDNVDATLVRDAARAAAIDAEIEVRPNSYDAPVAEGGRNFSGGQRQRLEIARVMLRKPGIIVLDEATSALDPLIEERVMDALLESGCGLLIIAHRLSTVRDCDEIIVMESGRVVERGTHDLLIASDGVYASLVGSE